MVSDFFDCFLKLILETFLLTMLYELGSFTSYYISIVSEGVHFIFLEFLLNEMTY